MSDLAAHGIDATDADLRALGYVKLDVEALREDFEQGAWFVVSDVIRQVLAALDGETT